MNKFTKNNQLNENELWRNMVLAEIDKNLTAYINKLNEITKNTQEELADIISKQNQVIINIADRVEKLEKNEMNNTADD